MKSILLFNAFITIFWIGSSKLVFSQTCATCPGNEVTGIKASAFGDGNTASGNYSFVAGRNSMAVQSNSAVIGSYSKASGGHSFVVGSTSFANGDFSYVFGGNSIADFDFSTAIGHNLHAMAGAFVLGQGRVNALLTNSLQSSLVIGFNSAYPTVFVSRTEYGMQSGRVGIGNVTDPQAKLHIKADEGEEASLLLEPSATDQTARIKLGQDHQISAKIGDHLQFSTADGKDFIFHQGDIFLEDIQSGIIMKSPNGQCWRGTLTDQGMLSFSQAACPAGAPVSVVQQSETGNFQVYPNPTGSMLTIETKLNGQATDLIINALNGQQLSRQSITSDKMEVSLEHYFSGTYVLQLVQKGQVIESRKIVKQ